MRRIKLHNSIFSISCFFCFLSVPFVASADGDPSELLQTNLTVQETATSAAATGNLLPDEQVAPPEEAVATVTAEGDFLLPTYLLPGETATVERTTTVEKTFEKTPTKMTSITIPVAQETVVSQKTTTTTTEPDDLQELIRQTAPAPMPEAVRTVSVETKAPSQTSVTNVPVANEVAINKPVTPRGKLLIPLAPVATVQPPEPALPSKERIIVPFEYADQMTDSLKNGQPVPFKMPHEIRITFYPRASAFSGQTLKWVRAFATAALQDPRLIVEIRSSCAEARLQDARLKLVKGVLAGAGLSTHQIIVNYTNRPVDTMLLRAVPRPEPSEVLLTPKDVKLPKSMSQVKKW